MLRLLVELNLIYVFKKYLTRIFFYGMSRGSLGLNFDTLDALKLLKMENYSSHSHSIILTLSFQYLRESDYFDGKIHIISFNKRV